MELFAGFAGFSGAVKLKSKVKVMDQQARLDHKLGHTGGRTLRSCQKVGKTSRPRPSGSPLSVLYESKTKRQIRLSEAVTNRGIPTGLGRAASRRRKQGCREDCYLAGWRSRSRHHLLDRESVGQFPLGSALHGKAYEEDGVGTAGSMRIRRRVSEAHWNPDRFVLDQTGESMVWGRDTTPTCATGGQNHGLLSGPASGSVAYVLSSPIPVWAHLSMGQVIGRVPRGRGMGRHGKEKAGKYKQHHLATDTPDGQCTGQEDSEGNQRRRKCKSHWRAEEPLRGYPAPGQGLEGRREDEKMPLESTWIRHEQRRRPIQNWAGLRRVWRCHSEGSSNTAGRGVRCNSRRATTTLKNMLESSGDPEEDVCQWLVEGFPLGIDKELKVNQVFPQTLEDTKAVEESRRFPLLTEEFDVDELENYKSFVDAGEAAERKSWKGSQSKAMQPDAMAGRQSSPRLGPVRPLRGLDVYRRSGQMGASKQDWWWTAEGPA